MQRMINSLKAFIQLSNSVVPILIVVIAIPLFFLAGFGVFVVFRDGYSLYFIGFLALSTVLITVPMLVLQGKRSKTPLSALGNKPENLPVKASTDWSDHDLQVWEVLKRHMVTQLQQNSKWEALQGHAMDLVPIAAEHYHTKNLRKELCFSAPELLKMIEEISRRYRRTLKTHVPFIERVNLSTFKMFYDQREKVGSVKKMYNIYRAGRAMTPAGMLAELRGQLLGRVFSGVSADLQYKMKLAFLQEVAAVAIDLYSGRFKVDDDSLGSSQATDDNRGNTAPALDPVRICFLGQVSTGKSSIINALTGDMVAEISKLPSTNSSTVYTCRVEGMDAVHLVDLPGLDGSDETKKQLLKEATNSDILLWVVKANQSARAIDVEFLSRLDTFYAEEKNRYRRRPVMIGVLNQVDRLKPLGEWQPPYDINDPNTPKARTIKDALEHNKTELNLDKILPLSVSENRRHFNLPALSAILAEEYAAGAQAQLNRRRIEAGNQYQVADQGRRLIRMGKSLFNVLTKNVS